MEPILIFLMLFGCHALSVTLDISALESAPTENFSDKNFKTQLCTPNRQYTYLLPSSKIIAIIDLAREGIMVRLSKREI